MLASSLTRRGAIMLVGLGVACPRALAATAAADKPNETAGEAPSTTAQGNKNKKYEDIPEENLILPEELYSLVEAGAVKDRSIVVLDIRSHRDYQKAQIEGSRNIPAGRQIEIRIKEIPRDKTVVLVALKNTNRLAETWYTLVARGYDPELLLVLHGGVDAWMKAGYPVLQNQFLGC